MIKEYMRYRKIVKSEKCPICDSQIYLGDGVMVQDEGFVCMDCEMVFLPFGEEDLMR